MTSSTRTSVRTWARRVLDTTIALTLALATLAGLVLAGVIVSERDTHRPVPVRSADSAPASRQYAEPGQGALTRAQRPNHRLVVAFVAGSTGTVASDLLAPYDVFASSPAFTTYIVADLATPAALDGGPAVVPTYTFADVDADPNLTPDLVVVSAVGKPAGEAEAPLRAWVTHQHDNGARVLGVCSGSLVLAATGMLDGLDATSHWSRVGALEKSRPAVHWMRGQRYIEDGSITTTAAVTSGVPAALHLVAELAGPAEARRVAHQHPEFAWTPTRSTRIPDDHFAVHDWPVGLAYVMPRFRPTVGIALHDGVDELDATAAFEVYGQSSAAHTVAIATGDTAQTRHGLVLLTTSITNAPSLSRVVVPGTDPLDPRLSAWADQRGLTAEALKGGGFSAALQNLADHTDATTASATAKMIGYPTTGLTLGSRHRAWRPVLLAIAAMTLAALVGSAPTFLARGRRRRRLQRKGAAAPSSHAKPDSTHATV
jgi:putative intracellular protease/amidase